MGIIETSHQDQVLEKLWNEIFIDFSYLHEQNTLLGLDVFLELHQISYSRLLEQFHLAFLQQEIFDNTELIQDSDKQYRSAMHTKNSSGLKIRKAYQQATAASTWTSFLLIPYPKGEQKLHNPTPLQPDRTSYIM